jgi:hypothetical protein
MELISGNDLCHRCKHPRDWHRLDDSTNISPTDPKAKFRCVGYDCTIDGPIGSCEIMCPDFVEP